VDHPPRALRRILGLGFGLAMVFGSTVGVGILRLPGTVAAGLGDPTLIILAWIVGGIYALMGAVAVAELAAMLPVTGGFRVFAQRAFGDRVGFTIGCVDWLVNVAALAWASLAAVTFIGQLWPAATVHPRLLALSVVATFTMMHWLGLRIGASATALISSTIGLMFLVLVVACFITDPVAPATATTSGAASGASPWTSMALLLAAVPALRAVLTSYDGWYSAIYMAEESTDPARTLPRAIIGGALLVTVLYVVINLALLRVLPLPVLAASELPVADAARVVLPGGGAELVTVLALLTALSLVNNVLFTGPRILFGIGRDGLLPAAAASVSVSGTPRGALLFTSAFAALAILSGTFEQIIAVAAVLFLTCYTSAFLAVFVLRRTEPALPRPYRASGFPASTAIVLAGSLVFLVAAVTEDPISGLVAGAFIACCLLVYAWTARSRRLRAAAAA
jgi:basic amino acid/polyamine antiporter, APA family